MATLNTTPNRGYQEPHVGNDLETDVGRVVAALRAIDEDVADAFAQLSGKASLSSPVFTGTPTAPTAVAGTQTNQLATTAFVAQGLAALVGMAPDALDTIEELAAKAEENTDLIDLLEAAVAAKADAAATTAALAGKANTADVTGALALKANTADVTDALALKANIANVAVRQTHVIVETTNVAWSAGGAADTGISITLQNNLRSTSSKVRIRASFIVGANGEAGEVFSIRRGDTDITPSGVNGHTAVWVAGVNSLGNAHIEIVDSPGATTPPTYKLYRANVAGAATTRYLGRRGADTVFDVPVVLVAEELVS